MNKILYVILFFFTIGVNAQEICNNGIDDDADGLIDLNDSTDCSCSGFNNNVPSSLIPNPSFEDHSCCPSGYSQLNCADTWIQASNPTSDYWNTCGQACGPYCPPPTPAGNGNGYVGFINMSGWQEYIGACLPTPMTAGNSYILNFWFAANTAQPTIDLTFFGASDCNNLPFNSNDCPVGIGTWQQLTQLTITPSGNWDNYTVTFTPTVDIYALVMGGACSSGGNYTYYYLDNLILNEISAFSSVDIVPSGAWCTNDLTLTALKDTTAGSWQWYLNGIALPGETNATIDVMTYGAGTYTALLSLNGDCDTKDFEVTLPPYPNTNFSFTNQCFPNSINFIDNSAISSGSIVNWQWDFGDGNSSSQQNPSHTYNSPGNYNVQLITTTDTFCTDTFSTTVTVFDLPQADFNYTFSQSGLNTPGGCPYESIQFNDNSTIVAPYNIVSWKWYFNINQDSAFVQNPTYSGFNTPGDYPVTLIVTSDSGCTDTITKTIHIYQVPSAQFSFYDDCVYNSAPFTDLSVANEPGATISAWNWTFGDGGSANTQNPSHQYNTDGDYIVQLIVTSSVGCMDTIQDTITRFPSPLALFSTADVCVYDSAHFNDLSSVNPPDSIITWLWNFGDGTPIVSAQNPAHLYSSYGSYNVNLIVSSNNGCVDDTTFSLYIHDKPVANFTADTPCVNVPPMQFTDLSTVNGIDNVNQWNWDFNTGQGTSSAQHPTFNFGQDGVFPTQLIVTTDFGCKDTVTKNVKVYEKPTADFSVDTAIFCHPYCVNFSDLSSSNTTNIIAWEWDLGNGEMNNSSAPATCYTNESNTQTQYYTPTLIVENSYGCFDTITKNNFITVWPLPLADFDAQPQPTDIYDPLVEFPNYSVGASSWLWHFGDGSNDSVNYSPQHEYADSGIYYVFLEVWSQYGCYDSIIKPIRINPDYAIFIPNAFTPDGLGGNETFFFKGYGIVEEDFEFWIFDRWGETIYYTQKFKPWDGTYKGEPAKQDVYVYKFIVKDIFDVKHTYIGKVTLLR